MKIIKKYSAFIIIFIFVIISFWGYISLKNSRDEIKASVKKISGDFEILDKVKINGTVSASLNCYSFYIGKQNTAIEHKVFKSDNDRETYMREHDIGRMHWPTAMPYYVQIGEAKYNMDENYPLPDDVNEQNLETFESKIAEEIAGTKFEVRLPSNIYTTDKKVFIDSEKENIVFRYFEKNENEKNKKYWNYKIEYNNNPTMFDKCIRIEKSSYFILDVKNIYGETALYKTGEWITYDYEKADFEEIYPFTIEKEDEILGLIQYKEDIILLIKKDNSIEITKINPKNGNSEKMKMPVDFDSDTSSIEYNLKDDSLFLYSDERIFNISVIDLKNMKSEQSFNNIKEIRKDFEYARIYDLYSKDGILYISYCSEEPAEYKFYNKNAKYIIAVNENGLIGKYEVNTGVEQIYYTEYAPKLDKMLYSQILNFSLEAAE